MNKMLLVLALILIAVPAFSMTMHGYVLKSVPAEEKWIPNAVIRCSSSTNDYVATSGGDGYYSIQGMEGGKYTCSVSANGYYSAIREVSLCDTGCDCNSCGCDECGEYKRVDFFLKPKEMNARIYGHVFRDGKGVKATVRCGGIVAESDPNGYYEMVLQPGTYYCTANGENGKYIQLEPYENRIVNFFLSTTTTVPPQPDYVRMYGYTYANGKKVPMRITCGSYSTESNYYGYYSMELPAGSYTCTAKYLSYYTTFNIFLSENTRRDIYISYPVVEKYRLYGYISSDGKRLGNVVINCNGNVANSNYDGYYEVWLEKGSYTCSFSKTGYYSKSYNIYISSNKRFDVELDKIPRKFRLYGIATPYLTLECSGPEYRKVGIGGSYSIYLKEGKYSCKAYAPGYSQESFILYLDKDTKKDITLEKECRFSFTTSSQKISEENFQVFIHDSSTCPSDYKISYVNTCDSIYVSKSRLRLMKETGIVDVKLSSSRNCYADIYISSHGTTRKERLIYKADTTPPSIIVRELSCRKIEFLVEATDDSGYANIRIYRDGIFIKECINYCRVVDEGGHEYRIVAIDRNGNKAEKRIVMESCSKAVIRGVVTSNGYVKGAIVKCNGKADETDSRGEFSIELERGYYVCTVIADGYEKKQFSINLDRDRFVRVVIEKKPVTETTYQKYEKEKETKETNVVSARIVKGNFAVTEAETVERVSWMYYARAILWWLALILAIALVIFIIIVLLSSK